MGVGGVYLLTDGCWLGVLTDGCSLGVLTDGCWLGVLTDGCWLGVLTDGKGANADGASAVFDKHVAAVHTAAEATLAAVDEVETVVLNVESHHITTCKKKGR